MHFQTLLPAILFAQSSFAYFCCYQWKDENAFTSFHTYFSADGHGGKDTWNPFNGCTITINKQGNGCGQWTKTTTKACNADSPYVHIGVAPNSACTGRP
ncbi:WD repeat-containing protein 5 [Venturia nashicola]|uniref:WD repeat-containing protein 5 n=1 Tax=Venturia nashicola TaxID=86259 RepID=A0A4Z1PKZ0_9PEZI|nr:WD repeat-containing protein 5 [Venturia nashicola]TLD38608.1 WD repeat-containing protein 5 [Venturia nashicola]